MKVSICIASYRRSGRLALLLGDLARQTRPPDEVVVIDNDVEGSARQTVQRFAAATPFPVRYAIQPQKNIALARNLSVEQATGDWIAFLDDDERAPPGWLEQLVSCVEETGADGVLGPVIPLIPQSAPTWIRRGDFYDWARFPTGTLIPPNRLRFGNLILLASRLRALNSPFDPALGLTGGEDGDLLCRLMALGAVFRWSDEAVIYEPVESTRLTLRWLLRRSLRGGQDFARHSLRGRYGRSGVIQRLALLARSIGQMIVAAALAVLMLPLGRHTAAKWLTRASANLGKLSVFFGLHYREYA